MAAHLVRPELSSGRRFYYAVNRRGFRELLNRLEAAEFIGKQAADETVANSGQED